MTNKAIVFTCGPSSGECRCDCGKEGGTCEHIWDGPMIEFPGGGSVTCKRCGMTAMAHDEWLW